MKKRISYITTLVISGLVVLIAACSENTLVDAPVAEIEAATFASTPPDAGVQKASTTTVRATGALNLTLPVACIGEDVRVFGPVDVRIHTTTDGAGNTHQMAWYSWKNVTAEGLTSGNTWHTTAAMELYTMLNFEPVEPHQMAPNRVPTGEPAVFHHSGAIRLISDGDAPNLYVRHLVQNVIDPNGNVRVDTDELELLECR